MIINKCSQFRARKTFFMTLNLFERGFCWAHRLWKQLMGDSTAEWVKHQCSSNKHGCFAAKHIATIALLFRLISTDEENMWGCTGIVSVIYSPDREQIWMCWEKSCGLVVYLHFWFESSKKLELRTLPAANVLPEH